MTLLSGDTHADLARRVACDRDRDAFARLFGHFAPRLNGYLQRLGLPAAVAEDMAQEVMIVLWHKAHLFDPAKSSLSTWLFRIARNRRIDAARRDRSHLIDPHDPMFQPAEAEPVAEAFDALRRDARIRTAMEELPPEQFQLVRAAFFEGLTQSEIAARDNIPLGTVKSRMRLAFTRLRRILEADDAVDTD